MRLRNIPALAVLLLVLTVSTLATPPASADARNGTCARGYRLATFSHNYPGYDHGGDLMWKIKWHARWCYSYKKRRIGSVYAPPPSVSIYGFFDKIWHSDGVIDRDAYYSNRDVRGQRHPTRPRWSHVSWYTIKLRHCVLWLPACSASHYRVGTIAYMDGSRNLIEPADGH